MRLFLAFGALASLASASCDKADAPGVEVSMQFARASFFDAPFPSDDLLSAAGTPDLSGWSPDVRLAILAQSASLISRDARGFGTTSGVFFSLTEAIQDARLPSRTQSMEATANVFLMNIDASSSELGRRMPVDVAFEIDGGRYGAPNMLSLVPVQGVPLRASTRYAAVVMRSAAMPRLGVSDAMASLADGDCAQGLDSTACEKYLAALETLATHGVDVAQVAGLTVFTTDDPLLGMRRVVDAMLARPLPVPTTFTKTDTFDSYCVYKGTLALPDYQSGSPPFANEGGDWLFDASGQPVFQRENRSNFVVTVPRSSAPAHGWPAAVFVRTGGGGDRPLVDRGTQAMTGGAAIEPGTGPALQFARAGYAGVQIDGPLGGLRNPNNDDEQFLIFNVFNGGALRDNVRQSAAELVLLAHVLPNVSFDTSDCDGASETMRFDASALALMGHSMGASIAPLVMAFAPEYRAVILSGAGASWIENVLYKTHPLDVAPAFEVLLGYRSSGRRLARSDIALSIVQWAAEAADSQVYAARIMEDLAPGASPRNILMQQGIVDHYIMPTIANAISVPLHLDFAGPALDEVTDELAGLPTLASMLAFNGRSRVAYPVRANFDDSATAVVVQYREDGVQDGHEVVFQLDAPKYQYKCFLQSLRGGTPQVLDGEGKSADAICQFAD